MFLAIYGSFIQLRHVLYVIWNISIYCMLTNIFAGQQVIYNTLMTGAPLAGAVTRKRPIRYTIRCGYDRFTKESSKVAVQPMVDAESEATAVEAAPIDFYMTLLDKRGFALDAMKTLEVDIDERVEAVIGGRNIEHMHLNVYATDCFVTPTPHGDDEIRYDLFRN